MVKFSVLLLSAIFSFSAFAKDAPKRMPNQDDIEIVNAAPPGSVTDIYMQMSSGLSNTYNQYFTALIGKFNIESTSCQADSDCEVFSYADYCGMGKRVALNKKAKVLAHAKALSKQYRDTVMAHGKLMDKLGDADFRGLPCPAMAMLPVLPVCNNNKCGTKAGSF